MNISSSNYVRFAYSPPAANMSEAGDEAEESTVEETGHQSTRETKDSEEFSETGVGSILDVHA